MICPYCDSLLKETPESGTCPNCGGPVGAPLRKKWGAAQKQKDLEYYYQRYKHDKIQAIVALRVDTGMDPVTAKQKIDKVFAMHAPNRQDDARTEDIIHCPKCLSTGIVMEQLVNNSNGYAWSYSAATKEYLTYRCSSCGYKWQTR